MVGATVIFQLQSLAPKECSVRTSASALQKLSLSWEIFYL